MSRSSGNNHAPTREEIYRYTKAQQNSEKMFDKMESSERIDISDMLKSRSSQGSSYTASYLPKQVQDRTRHETRKSQHRSGGVSNIGRNDGEYEVEDRRDDDYTTERAAGRNLAEAFEREYEDAPRQFSHSKQRISDAKPIDMIVGDYSFSGNAASSSSSPPTSPNDSTVFNLRKTDMNCFFGTEIPGTVLVVAPPKQGKTTLLTEFCYLLSQQVDIIYLFTLTPETVVELQEFVPLPCMFTNLTNNQKVYEEALKEGKAGYPGGLVYFKQKFQDILNTHQNLANDIDTPCKAAVILDDILLTREYKQSAFDILQKAVKIAHRARCWTFISCHMMSDLWGDISSLIDRIAFVGNWEAVSKSRESVDILCSLTRTVIGLETEAKLKSMWEMVMKEKGKAIIIQKDAKDQSAKDGNSTSVTCHKFKPLETRKRFAIGHRDLYILVHKYGPPRRKIDVTSKGIRCSDITEMTSSKQISEIEEMNRKKSEAMKAIAVNGGPSITTSSIQTGKGKNIKTETFTLVSHI